MPNTIRLHRVLRASPDRVYRAFLDPDEMREALRDLRAAGCEILTVGQYLSPSKDHHPVAEFVTPEVFTAYREYAMELGFRAAFCGPFVRSSYQAEQVFGSEERGARSEEQGKGKC